MPLLPDRLVAFIKKVKQVKMDKIYYAHSGHDPAKSDWQLLSDHLTRVACLAGENASYFRAEQLATVCGLLHDLGKYSEAFAKRL
jgi:CRISPR-associated endonuclease/helicase Cas3